VTARPLPEPGHDDLDVRDLLRADPHVQLMGQVSVQRTATAVVELFDNAPSVLRLVMDALAAFADSRPESLATVLADAWAVPGSADRALARFAAATQVHDDDLARLGLGPKLWFTINGAPVSWQPLHGGGPPPPRVVPALTGVQRRAGGGTADDGSGGSDLEQAAAAELAAHGIDASEAATLRLGNLGRLAPGPVFVPDLVADPLIVRRRAVGRRRSGERAPLTVLGQRARLTLLSVVLERHAPDAACRHPESLALPTLR